MNEQEEYDWMVYVSCMTFNHAPYIEDAMNGFTMQETDFPFVCAIVDDASTDGEQEVIKTYLNEYFDLEDKKVTRHEETDDYVLTFARHKTNLNCHFAVLYLKYNHYGKKSKVPYFAQWRDKAKYIAVCEGDDYWINPLKLQLQVDELEKHKEFSICICGYVKKNMDESSELTITTDVGFSFDNDFHISNVLPIQPATWLRRRSMIPLKETQKYKNKYDIVELYLTLRNGRGYYIPDVCCVYRFTGKGIFSQLNNYEKIPQALNPRIELCKNYPEDKALKKRCAYLYSSYIFYSILNRKNYTRIPLNILGLRLTVYSYLRVLSMYFYSWIKPRYRKNYILPPNTSIIFLDF